MIRVRIELIPVGIDELAVEVEQLTINCKFPLIDDTNQQLQVFTNRGMGFAEIDGYNLRDTVYRIGGPDMSQNYLDLVHRAIDEITLQKTTRTGEEIYPGFLRYPKEQEKEYLRAIGQTSNRIKTITLFGEPVKPDNFTKALALNKDIRWDGHELMKLYEGYKYGLVALRLDSELYQDMQQAELIEGVLWANSCRRLHPHVRKMKCYNGLIFFFIRPDGSICCPALKKVVTESEGISFPEDMWLSKADYSLQELQSAIAAGEIVYRKPQPNFRHKQKSGSLLSRGGAAQAAPQVGRMS